MTLSLRQRTALALTGAMVSAPLWGTAAAFASTTIVTFSGQPLLTGAVSCPSRPSVLSITVPAGATVNFADRLGVAATLWAGDSHTQLKDGQMVPVTFGAGPMSVPMQMLPDCTLDLGSHESMTVNVTAAPAGTATTPKPTRSAEHTPTPAPSTPGAARSSRPPLPWEILPGGGAPPAQSSVALGSPVASRQPARGASGLLTLIATVSLVGVSAAAIRAIIAQRASRALTA